MAGLGSWLNSPEQNIAQIQRALAPDEHGRALAGVGFFSYDKPVAGANPERRRAFMDHLRATVFAGPAQAPSWPWIVAPSTGHLQGMAVVDGQITPDAKVSLIHEGQWLKDIYSGADGWFGAVELPPGRYTVVVTRADGRQGVVETTVMPGLVSSI